MLQTTYAPIFAILVVAFGVSSLFWIGASTLGTKNPTREKMLPFECGSESSGGRHLKLSVKFYMTAILFVVFDVETIFLFPWAVKFKACGLFGLVEMLIFLLILIVGYIWIWGKGALEWV